jgi:hypothetical protein
MRRERASKHNGHVRVFEFSLSATPRQRQERREVVDVLEDRSMRGTVHREIPWSSPEWLGEQLHSVREQVAIRRPWDLTTDNTYVEMCPRTGRKASRGKVADLVPEHVRSKALINPPPAAQKARPPTRNEND